MKLFPEAVKYCKDNLVSIIQEVDDWHNTGELVSGCFRHFANLLLKEAPTISDHKLQVAENVFNSLLRKFTLEQTELLRRLSHLEELEKLVENLKCCGNCKNYGYSEKYCPHRDEMIANDYFDCYQSDNLTAEERKAK